MTDKSFRPLQQQQKVPLSPVSAHGNFSKTPEYLTHTRARSHTQGQIRSNLLSNSSSPMLTAVQGFPSNVLSIPLSPTLSARSLGFGQGSSLTNVTTTNDDPLNSAQHELRKKSQAAFNDMSNLFRDVARTSDTSEELMRYAKAMSNLEPVIRSTKEALTDLASLAQRSQELNQATLEKLACLSNINDELDVGDIGRLAKLRG